MDGAVLTDEGRAELAALRRRAFGPDADIFDDPAALERLRELEASVLPACPPVLSSSVDAGFVGTPAPAGGASAQDDLEPVSAGSRALGRLRDVAVRFTSRRTGRAVSALVAGVLIAVAGGMIGWGIAQPHPDRILVADRTQYAPTGQGTDLWLKEMYGISGVFHGHVAYGHVHVFTGTARNGSECMVLMIGADDAVGTSCSPRPLPASVDLFILPGWTQTYTGLDLPAGSIVRFVQSGDDVEVWTAVMPTTAPTL